MFKTKLWLPSKKSSLEHFEAFYFLLFLLKTLENA